MKFGISAALLTPFDEQHQVDAKALAGHARHLLDQGIASVTVFGTTGEGASIGVDERRDCLGGLLSAGIAPHQIVLGLSASAAADACDQIARARQSGIDTFLVPPPYYFKNCSDDGLFDWHMQVISQSDPAAQIILYHIPQVTEVPLSVDLVDRLAAAAPGRIRAIKDSSGNWENTQALLNSGSTPVLVGDERQLHRAAALGADGSICGFSNLYPDRLIRLFETATEDPALTAEATRVDSHSVIPALKVLLAAQTGEPAWERVRPPLTPLDAGAKGALLAARERVD